MNITKESIAIYQDARPASRGTSFVVTDTPGELLILQAVLAEHGAEIVLTAPISQTQCRVVTTLPFEEYSRFNLAAVMPLFAETLAAKKAKEEETIANRKRPAVA